MNAKKESESSLELESKTISLSQAIKMLKDDSISAKIKNNFLKEIIQVIYYKKDKLGNITLDIYLR